MKKSKSPKNHLFCINSQQFDNLWVFLERKQVIFLFWLILHFHDFETETSLGSWNLSYVQNGVNFQFFKKTGVKLGSFSKSSVGFNFRFLVLNFDEWSILTLFCTILFIDLKNIILSPQYNFSNTGQFMMPTRYNN